MGKNRDHSKFPNAITVLDNGNVGINTSNFSTVISSKELKIGSDTNGAFVLGNTTTSIYGFVYGSTNAIDIGSGNAITLQTWNGTTYAERARITNSGSFGVGTSGPTRGIHISRNSDQAAILITKANDTANVAYLGTGSSSTGAGTENAILQMWHNGTENIRLYTQGNSWITGGNFGVGTVSPNNKLSIVDSGYNQYSLRLESASGNTANRWGGIGFAGEGSNTKAGIFFVSEGGSYSRGNLVFANNSDFNQNSATPSDARMSITKEGYITKTGQPFFSAYNSSGASYTGDQTVIWGTALHNVGNGYNTSTGRFTAPVAGVYLFRADFRGSGVSGYVMDIATSTGLLTRHEEYASYANFYHQTLAAIYKLNAGDYVYVWARSGTIAPDGNSLDRFEGYLLG